MRKHPTPGDRNLPHGLTILYEDGDLIVVDKPSGLLSVRSALDRSATAHQILEDYVRKGQAKSRKRLFVVHRLDKFTSGVLVFAKSHEAKERLQANWNETTSKTYLAVVHGHIKERSGTVSSYLTENAQQVVYSKPDKTKGKLSHTAWRVLREAKDVSLLEVRLLTGRKNQIRVHMADLGHPVVGDRKYGAAKNAPHGAHYKRERVGQASRLSCGDAPYGAHYERGRVGQASRLSRGDAPYGAHYQRIVGDRNYGGSKSVCGKPRPRRPEETGETPVLLSLVRGARGRLALHAWKIAFRHPRDGRPMEFTSAVPELFRRLAGAIPGGIIDKTKPSAEISSETSSETSSKIHTRKTRKNGGRKAGLKDSRP